MEKKKKYFPDTPHIWNYDFISTVIIKESYKTVYPPQHTELVSDCKYRGLKFRSQLGHITSMEIDLEVISTVILPLPLIQGGQLTLVLLNPDIPGFTNSVDPD